MYLKLASSYKHFKRYREITQILLKNGFGFLIEILDLKKFLPFKKRFKKHNKEFNKTNLAKRLRLVLQELGPTFIKLGQLLSTRADIIDPEFIDELSKLQDEVQGVEFSKIVFVINEELGEDYHNYFDFIEKDYHAAASIAQTHKARLKNGKEVMLKVQRPGIEKKIKSDLEILTNMANMLKKRKLVPDHIEPKNLIDQFKEDIINEMNFDRELTNIKRIASNFSDNPHIIIPEVYQDFSTRRLLVMEEIKGIKLSQINLAENKIDQPYIAKLGAWVLFKQVLIDGFFHADPHPGNIFVVDKDKLAYVDFGLVGQITESDQDLFTIIFLAVLGKEPEIIVDKIMDIGVIPKDINKRALILEVDELLNRYHSRSLDEIDINTVNNDIQRLIYKFHIRMPQEFFLLMRSIAVSEGVGSSLDSNFNIFAMKDRFLKDLLKDRTRPDYLAGKLFHKLWNLRRSTKKIPEELGRLLEKLVDDEFSIKFQHNNLEPLISKLDIVSNRLSVSLIISALLIGSSMLLQTDIKPHIFGIPFLGFLGYSSAGVLGLWLVITIFKSGKF